MKCSLLVNIICFVILIDFCSLLDVLKYATDGTAESVNTVVPWHGIYGHTNCLRDYCCCSCHHDDVAHGPQISQVVVYRLPCYMKGTVTVTEHVVFNHTW